ncbi:hypothetical protein VUJ46_07450 [Chryseobacterium sp. MYb264]|uniref:hypothetical protein n=1 Tax=Chryseobacterium sp. MYb264 TaxID=2745153 RepID=UPI002E12E3B1|nr:hypothetical protein VUJ46_07450 [Chryseobacterium sp. MYb264]
MKLIDQYEKDGNSIQVDSLLTTNDAVIDIKQIFILGNNVYVSFDMEHERILITETADVFIQKNKEFLKTLTKKAYSKIDSCKCDSCQ